MSVFPGSCIFALLVVIGCRSSVGGQISFDGNQALAYIEMQLSFGPRTPNTEGHRRAGDWIHEQLRARADTVEVQDFTHVTLDGDTLHLRNFIGRFRPAARDRILFLAHWDTRPRADASAAPGEQQLPVPGANDGGSGVAILLGVADQLRWQRPAYGVDLLFVDGEDYGDFGDGRDVLLGSRHFVEHLSGEDHPLFAVLFDMVGDRDLQITQEGHSLTGAPEVVERIWRTAGELGYETQFPRRGGPFITDDHLPLLEAGIRAVNVIDFDYPYHHTVHDTIDKVSARSLQIVGEVAIALVR